MAFVGMLDQLQLSHIFKHIQLCEQTGLLTIARCEQRIGLYFQQGQLIYLEPPVSTSAEPSPSIAAPSTLFKTPKLLIEASSLPPTPRPLLFKKPKPAVKKPSTSLVATSPVVQEQRSPATPVPSLSDAGAFINRAIVPPRAASLPHPSSDTPTIRPPASGTLQ